MIIPGRAFPLGFLVFFVIGIFVLTRELKSGKRQVQLSRMPAFAAIDEAVGRAAELGRPVHYMFGWGSMDASVFASFKILGYVADKCARLDVRMIVSIAVADEQPIVEEILMTAWRSAGKPERYQPDFVRFLSTGGFASTTGVWATFARERPAANLMLGPFFNESLLIPAAGRKVGALQIGGTTVTIQVPFIVATCDYSLIGEELMVAGAYLSGTPLELASVAVQDVAKLVTVALCCLGCLMNLFGAGGKLIHILGI